MATLPRQHLNLIDAALLPRRQRGSAAQVLTAGLLLLGATGVAAYALTQAAGQARAERALLATLPAAATPAASAAIEPTAALQAEITQLRALHAAQARVRAALDAGAAGSVQGHGDYFLALARRADPHVWITGFAVGADGQALTLEGRMTDAAQLPGYLRRLNEEERFRGRPFAQLQIRTLEASATQPEPVVEFTLRSQPATGAAK